MWDIVCTLCPVEVEMVVHRATSSLGDGEVEVGEKCGDCKSGERRVRPAVLSFAKVLSHCSANQSTTTSCASGYFWSLVPQPRRLK